MWWAAGGNKRKKTRQWQFCSLDSEDRWARLPGEVGKVHIGTSVVELRQKALLLLQAQHSEGLGLWGKSHFSGNRDLSLRAPILQVVGLWRKPLAQGF